MAYVMKYNSHKTLRAERGYTTKMIKVRSHFNCSLSYKEADQCLTGQAFALTLFSKKTYSVTSLHSSGI